MNVSKLYRAFQDITLFYTAHCPSLISEKEKVWHEDIQVFPSFLVHFAYEI